MARFSVKVLGVKDLTRALDKLGKSQVPFVTSKTINDVAKEAQSDIRTHLRDEFIIRRKSFMTKSVKITKFSNKREGKDMKAVIAIVPPGGAQDVFSKHEKGGRQTPESSEHFAVPSRGIWKNKNRVLSKRLRPANIVAWKVNDLTSGALILMRNRTKKIQQVAYLLVKSIRLEPRLEFVKTARKTVNRSFEKTWEREFRKATKKSRFGK